MHSTDIRTYISSEDSIKYWGQTSPTRQNQSIQSVRDVEEGTALIPSTGFFWNDTSPKQHAWTDIRGICIYTCTHIRYPVTWCTCTCVKSIKYAWVRGYKKDSPPPSDYMCWCPASSISHLPCPPVSLRFKKFQNKLGMPWWGLAWFSRICKRRETPTNR